MIQASTLAPQIDLLFFTEVAICASVLLGIMLTLFYFSKKYGAHKSIDRSLPPKNSKKLELYWTMPSLIIFMVFFIWGANIYVQFKSIDKTEQEVFVMAKQWVWKFQYPDGRREFNELHVPIHKKIKLTLISEDVIHSLFIPQFRIKQDVLPGRYTTVVFEATQSGSFPILCTQYCGVSHDRMLARVIVLKDEDYKSWASESGTVVGKNENPSLKSDVLGLALFKGQGCASCHSSAPEQEQEQAKKFSGPSIWNLYGRNVTLQDGSTIYADDNYIHESVFRPNAKVVAGHRSIMPTFIGLISEEEFLHLLAYIKSLKPKSGLK